MVARKSEKHHVLSHTSNVSSEIKNGLEKIKESSQYIGDVRGIGMMFGIELVKDKNTKEPFPEATKLLRKLCYENGLIVEVGGYHDNVIRFLPPLTITKEIAENGLRIFADANKAMKNAIALLDTRQ